MCGSKCTSRRCTQRPLTPSAGRPTSWGWHWRRPPLTAPSRCSLTSQTAPGTQTRCAQLGWPALRLFQHAGRQAGHCSRRCNETWMGVHSQQLPACALPPPAPPPPPMHPPPHPRRTAAAAAAAAADRGGASHWLHCCLLVACSSQGLSGVLPGARSACAPHCLLGLRQLRQGAAAGGSGCIAAGVEATWDGLWVVPACLGTCDS